MYKIVYNGCYGGFSLSLEAAEMLAKKGNKEAQEYIDRKPKQLPAFDYAFVPFDLPRHSKELVDVVEALGEKANGGYTELKIAHIFSSKYIIRENGGRETVVEPEDISWIEIKEQ